MRKIIFGMGFLLLAAILLSGCGKGDAEVLCSNANYFTEYQPRNIMIYDGGKEIYSEELSIISLTAESSRKLRDAELAGKSALDEVGNLTCLETLYVMGSKSTISNISPLSNLKNMKALSLYKVDASDISPLAGLTKLKFLDISDVPVSDIAPLTNLKDLVQLSLHNTNVSDISPLRQMTNLKELILTDNPQLAAEDCETLKTVLPNTKVRC